MNTLVCSHPGFFEYQELPAPVLKSDHAIIKIKKIGICGTDLHAFDGSQPFFEYPRILGHELSGELVEFDNAPGFQAGEKVTIIPYVNCEHCAACRQGKPNCCVNLKVIGVHIDGGMVEYLSVPSRLLIHGQGLDFEELAMVEPMAIAAHGVRRANIKSGEFVLVIGAGPIGLGIMEFARIAGAKVIAMDMNERRLDFCSKGLGIEYVVNAGSGNVKEQISQITNGDMPGVVFDATGSLQAINGAFNYMAHGGQFVLVGLQKGDIIISHPEFHKREGTLMSSRNATRADFDYVISCMKNGLVQPRKLINYRVEFNGVKEDSNSWLHPEKSVIKGMISL